MDTYFIINAVMIGFLVALLGIIAIRELMK
jgi:Pyruvate/2-oxoacid:ferredoxin oxidoreductase gamma subunit